MLGYRHGFHAGNHADALKHITLVLTARYLTGKPKPLWYIDTHAGAGLYQLADSHLRNREYTDGIGRLWQMADAPAAVGRYLDAVRSFNPDGGLHRYPGSALLMQRLLRPDDRLRLFELHGSDYEALVRAVAGDRRVRIEHSDGFAALKALLPPPTRRALVLIDPSYELVDDYRRVVVALAEAIARFATGVYIVWYPQLDRGEADALPRQLASLAPGSWLNVRLTVAPRPNGRGMYGSGVFVINPTWTLADELAGALPWLAARLGGDGGAWCVDCGDNRRR